MSMRDLFVWVISSTLFACGGSSGAGGDVCARANDAVSACDGSGPIYSSDQACDEESACSASCIVATPCDWTTIGHCVRSQCQHIADPSPDAGHNGTTPYDTGAPYVPHDSGSSGWDSGGGGSSGGSDSSSSGSSTPPRPECVSYAEKYCGCLGSMASSDCVPTRAAGCEDSIDFCPSFYSCFLASSGCGSECRGC